MLSHQDPRIFCVRLGLKASHEVTAGRCLPAPSGRPLLRPARKHGFSVVSVPFSRLSSARLRSRREQRTSVGEAASAAAPAPQTNTWKAADHRGDAEKNSVTGPGSGASNYSHRVFRLDTDPAFVALANVADETDLKARGAVNSAKANPAFVLTANNLAAPITLVSHGSCAISFRPTRPFWHLPNCEAVSRS